MSLFASQKRGGAVDLERNLDEGAPTEAAVELDGLATLGDDSHRAEPVHSMQATVRVVARGAALQIASVQ